MTLKITRASEQDEGAFDGGNITERKPVNFPGQGSQTERYGPLLYWACAKSERGGFIAEHFHKGFEIISYVLQGSLEHRDSLGSWKSLHPGDLQVMQTNSGVSHSERFSEDEHTEMFQIWFEPNLRQTMQRQPRYTDYPAEKFQWRKHEGYAIKPIVGKGAPLQLVTDVQFDDVIVEPSREFTYRRDDAFAVVVAIEGLGEIREGSTSARVGPGDAAYLRFEGAAECSVHAVEQEFRFAQVIVPVKVAYSLYLEY